MALGFDQISMWMGTHIGLATESPTGMRYLTKLAVLNCLMGKPDRFRVPMIEVDRKEEFSLVCFC